MSGQTAEKLAYMANQIARNMALDETPVVSVADHITAFWTPVMIDMLIAEGQSALDPIAAAAMVRISEDRSAALGR